MKKLANEPFWNTRLFLVLVKMPQKSKNVNFPQVRIALTEDGVPMSVLREISLLRHLGKMSLL